MTASMCSRRPQGLLLPLATFMAHGGTPAHALAGLLDQPATRYDRSLPTRFLRWNSLANDALKTLQVH
jgi:hypothetical protein